MKSWIRRLLVLGIVLVVAGGTVLYLAANVFFQPEKLVRKLEKRLNCRASMSAVETLALCAAGTPGDPRLCDGGAR